MFGRGPLGAGMDIQHILSTCTDIPGPVTLGGYSQPQVNLVQVVLDAHPSAFSTLGCHDLLG